MFMANLLFQNGSALRNHPHFNRIRFFGILLFFSLFVSANTSCKKKNEYPSQEIVQAYQKNAQIFCTAVVECFKEDARIRLREQPERARLITSKMDMDLCRENQYFLIGQTSVVIKPTPPSTDEGLYKSYENCALAVASGKDCKSRFSTYKTHPDCMRIKQKL